MIKIQKARPDIKSFLLSFFFVLINCSKLEEIF